MSRFHVSSVTDGQTDIFFDTIYGGSSSSSSRSIYLTKCRFFLTDKFATYLLASLAGGLLVTI